MNSSRRFRLTSAVVALAVLLTGCAASPVTSSTTPSFDTLPGGTNADYQLGGSYDPPEGVGIVARDSSEYPADGAYSICYVNGFQSQPQEADFWLDEHPDLLLRYTEGVAAGEPVIDANWPDEMIFDTSTSTKREGIADVIGETIAQCGERGFDAVEFDNLDSWSRTSGALTLDDSIALASLLVDAATDAGLAAGQKNSAELGSRGRDEAGFRFAVSEECAVFDECGAYSDVYGDDVIDIEYADSYEPDEVDASFADVCASDSRVPLTILRDRNLTTPDSADYVYESC